MTSKEIIAPNVWTKAINTYLPNILKEVVVTLFNELKIKEGIKINTSFAISVFEYSKSVIILEYKTIGIDMIKLDKSGMIVE